MTHPRVRVYKPYMTPSQHLFTFVLPVELKEGLRFVKERDGISEAEQIRRGIALWLASKHVKAARKRAVPRKRA